jgi:hypothetical protein
MGGPSRSGRISPPRKAPPGFLRLSVDHPQVKFELESSSPEQALPEVRRIIEALNADQGVAEESALAELRLRLTEEFCSHRPLLSRLRSAIALDEDVRILKRTIPVTQEYDLETGTQTRQLLNVKEAVGGLFDQLGGTVRDCLVHIRGDLPAEQQRVIMDAVRQRLGVDVQPRFFATRKNLEGRVLLEAVCFGEGMPPE